MAKAMPACTARSCAVSSAAKLQARAHTAKTRPAHRAQKMHPAKRLCQNTKGAQNTPGTAAPQMICTVCSGKSHGFYREMIATVRRSGYTL